MSTAFSGAVASVVMPSWNLPTSADAGKIPVKFNGFHSDLVPGFGTYSLNPGTGS